MKSPPLKKWTRLPQAAERYPWISNVLHRTELSIFPANLSPSLTSLSLSLSHPKPHVLPRDCVEGTRPAANPIKSTFRVRLQAAGQPFSPKHAKHLHLDLSWHVILEGLPASCGALQPVLSPTVLVALEPGSLGSHLDSVTPYS